MPFFRLLQSEFVTVQPNFIREGNAAYGSEQAPQNVEEEWISLLVDLTQQVFLVIERELQLTGFWESIPARNKLKAELQTVLLAPRFIKVPGIVQKRGQIISRLLELAQKNNDTILYAV